MPTLHVHADESGDFNFTPGKGTTHYVYAAAWTYEPAPLAAKLQELRYELLREGVDLDHFHAAEDQLEHRDRVIDALLSEDGWRFAAVVVDKDQVFLSLHDELEFTPRFMPMVLNFVIKGRIREGTDRVLIYTDRLPIQKKKKSVKKAIHQFCADEIPASIRFHMYHHDSASNAWLQVVDYCCWSVFRKHERGESYWYDRLKPRLAAEELYLWP